MDSRTLTQFLSLSQTLHFGRSSEECHISPSALSRAIKHLEEELGAKLFERDNRRVQLTTEGRRLQAYARDALHGWDTFRATLIQDERGLQGEISVFCSVTASYSFLYEILSDFRQRHPRIELKLHTGDPAQGIHRVSFGHEDMAIIIRPERLSSNLTFRRIAVSPLVFIAPGNESVNIPRSRSEWTDTPMIVSEEGVSRERVNRWFRRLGIEPTIYAQIAGHEAIVSMVALGFGIGVVPKIVLDNSPLADRVTVADAEPQLGEIDVGLCVLKKRLKSPIIKAFWGEEEQNDFAHPTR